MTLLSRVVLIVIVALLPALAAEVYNQQILRAAQRAEVRDDAQRLAYAVGVEVNRVLDGARNALVGLAALPEIAGENRAACPALLTAVRRRAASLTDLSLVGADDAVVCSTRADLMPGAAAGDWPEVRQARERGHMAVTGYRADPLTGGPGLGAGLPVRSAEPRSGPVLVAGISTADFAGAVRAMALQDAAAIVVADRHGLVLLSVANAAEFEGPRPGTALPASMQTMLSAVHGGVAIDWPDPQGAVTPLAVQGLPNVVVTARSDPTFVASAQTRAAARSYATFGLGLAVALACALLLARYAIGRPVARILRTIALWRLGAHQPRVPHSDSVSELGRIGRALNDLLVAFERTEAELRASKAELELRVEARTRELEAEVREREATQALLQQSQKMEVIGQLTGGVAHDFNNLLTAILGNLELATMRSGDQPEVVRLLTNAARAADRGAALTQRMLAFGRRQFLRPQAVDVAALLMGMEDLLARTIGPTVVIAVRTEAGLWPARADPNQLELVVLNLAINARDAMPQGGSLVIAASNQTVTEEGAAHAAGPHSTVASNRGAPLDPGDYVRMTMRDDGIGMDSATLARVLEPFFTTKPAGKGSGLGLSMAHGVAAQLGGALAIDSASGQGTTVSVWLPRDSLPARVTPGALRLDGPRPVVTRSVSDTRAAILLVDDDPEVAEVAQQCLVDQGYVVHHAPTGGDALALVESGVAVDLLIADLAMPGINGVQLAERVRILMPALPVLLATGYAESGKVDADAARYPILGKPFRAAQLGAAVAELIGTKAR